ncbi:MAG: hypothetical protein ACFNXV_02645 [Pauljensenia sp.]
MAFSSSSMVIRVNRARLRMRCGWFAFVLEVVKVDQEFSELVQACSGVVVGVGEVVEPGGDLVEAGADAVLFALEESSGIASV